MSLSRSATTVTIAADDSTCLACSRGFDPTPRFPLRQRTIPVRLGHHTVAGSNIAAYQAQAGMAVSVHRDHDMRQDPVGVAFLHPPQAAAALRCGGEFHLRGILDRQYMPPSHRRGGSQAPSLDDPRRRHLGVGEEPARLQFATTVTTQPAQAHRLACDHPFEDRTPPLYRGADPRMIQATIPSSAPVLRLPR
jgi:hypothetical protein